MARPTPDYDREMNRLIARSLVPTTEMVGLLAERARCAANALVALPTDALTARYEAAVNDLEREVAALAELAAGVKRIAAGLDAGAF